MAKVTVIPEITKTETIVVSREVVKMTLSADEAEYLTWLVAHIKLDWLTSKGEEINNSLYKALTRRNQTDEEKQKDGYEKYIWTKSISRFGAYPDA
jgi:hypothetical protein